MKKLLSVLFLLAVSASTDEAFCQSNFPSLKTLMRWANDLPYATAHTDVKNLGFEFDAKNEEAGETRYEYVRNVADGGILYTEVLNLTTKNSQVYRVQFSTSRIDLNASYNCETKKRRRTLRQCFGGKP